MSWRGVLLTTLLIYIAHTSLVWFAVTVILMVTFQVAHDRMIGGS